MFKRQKYSETIFLPKKIKQRGVVYRDKFKKIVKVIAEFDKFKKIFFVTDYGPKAAVIININGKFKHFCSYFKRNFGNLIFKSKFINDLYF